MLADRPLTLWRYKEFLPAPEAHIVSWSFKDRMAASGAAIARDMGCKVLPAASSGNGGAATAAYAARGGLEAVVFTTQQFPPTMRAFMQSYGARIIATPTMQDRWTMVMEGVPEHDWFPSRT